MKNFLNSAAYTVLGLSHVGDAFHVSAGSMTWLVTVAYLTIAITYLLQLWYTNK